MGRLVCFIGDDGQVGTCINFDNEGDCDNCDHNDDAHKKWRAEIDEKNRTNLKVFEYTFFERWGNGQGIVIAESVDEAIKMMRKPYSDDKSVSELFPELVFEEVDITKKQVIDHSWCE